MPNPKGRGVRGVPATTVAAFLDHYTYTGYNPSLPPSTITRRINGVPLTDTLVRTFRRWRNGQVDRVSAPGLARTLDLFGFTLPGFHAWAKERELPLT